MKSTSICKYCQKPFNFLPSRSTGTYCSNKCQQKFKFLTITIPRIEQGLVNHHNTLKRFLIYKYNEICSICKNTNQWNNLPLSLHVDHIDGNSDNNFPSNLRLLCPNCHSQQPTTKNRIKKNTKRNKYLRKYKNGTE